MDNPGIPPTTAVVARIIKIEIPYLWSFIEHYRKLGVNRIYLQSTNKADYPEIRDYLLSRDKDCLDSRVALLDMDIPGDQLAECLNLVRVTEDYVINVDIDEFLEIDHPDLRSLIADTPSDYYRFDWVMVPSDALAPTGGAGLESGFHGHTGKYMVRASRCKKMYTHVADMQDDVVPLRTGRLIHYWGRSFRDMLFKCCYQRFENPKRSSLSEVHEIVKSRSLPVRMKLLALLCRKEKTVPVRNYYLRIDHGYEKRLEAFFRLEAVTEGIFREYEAYKRVLSEDVIALYPQRSLLNLAAMLASEGRSRKGFLRNVLRRFAKAG